MRKNVDVVVIFCIYTLSTVEPSPRYTTVVNLVSDYSDFYCDRDNVIGSSFFTQF